MIENGFLIELSGLGIVTDDDGKFPTGVAVHLRANLSAWRKCRNTMPAQGSPNFGRYEILAELGQGAMGVVYKARDPKIERLVAIKTIALRGQNAKDEREFRERFFNEARAAGRLVHPRIITIFDVSEELERHDPFIVMEYVAGQSLEEHLSSGRKQPLANGLQLVQEIALRTGRPAHEISEFFSGMLRRLGQVRRGPEQPAHGAALAFPMRSR